MRIKRFVVLYAAVKMCIAAIECVKVSSELQIEWFCFSLFDFETSALVVRRFQIPLAQPLKSRWRCHTYND